MPFSGSGVYTAPASPGGFKPAVAGQLGQPTDWNTLLADIESALSTMICRDGQSTVTADIPMGGHKFTGLANGVADTDSVTVGQAAAMFPTGVVWDYIGTTPPAGWILAWGTIGNGASGGTNRANADTEHLFTLLYNSWIDAMAPVSGGRTTDAAADYALNKTITVPDLRGRARAGLDNMGGTAASRLTSGTMTPNGTTLGATGGAQSTLLSVAQMANQTVTGQATGASFTLPAGTGASLFYSTTQTTPVVQVQPTMLFNAIIKL